jgi:hypothetical protein
VHLSELDDDGASQPWVCWEAELGKGAAGEVGDVGKAKSREGSTGDGDGRREGWGTSMSSMTPVEAQGGNSGAASCRSTRKQNRGRGRQRHRRCQEAESGKGPPVRSAMQGSRVEGGSAPVMEFGSLTACYEKSSSF